MKIVNLFDLVILGSPREMIIVAGGKDSTDTFVPSSFLYDVSGDTWSSVPQLPATVWSFIPRAGSLLAFSAEPGGDSYAFDPASGTWILVPVLAGMGRDMGYDFGGVLIEDDTPFHCVD